MKQVSLKSLHTVWFQLHTIEFQLYDVLEKARSQRQLKKNEWLPGVGNKEGGMNKQSTEDF